MAVGVDTTAMVRTAGSFSWGTTARVDRFWLVAVMMVTVAIIVGGGIGVDIIIMGSVIEVMVFGVKA